MTSPPHCGPIKLLVTESDDNPPKKENRDSRDGVACVPYRGKSERTPHVTYTATSTGQAMNGPAAAPAQPKTVLVVEDNELNMKLFHDLLEANGYRVLQTRDGLSALDLARQHMPDLILMDIQLPEVSGIEVTKWLKEDDELKSIPVIAVTAFAMKGDEEKIREGGCEAYISKPISVLSFLQMVDSFLKRPQ